MITNFSVRPSHALLADRGGPLDTLLLVLLGRKRAAECVTPHLITTACVKLDNAHNYDTIVDYPALCMATARE